MFQVEKTDRGAFDVKSAAEYLSLSTSFIWQKVKSREIPSFKIGDRVLLKKVDVDKFLEKGKR